MRSLAFVFVSLFSLCSCSQGSGVTTLPNLWNVEVPGYGSIIVAEDIVVGYAEFEDNSRFAAIDLATREVVWRSRAVPFQLSYKRVAVDGDYTYIAASKLGLIVHRGSEEIAFIPEPEEENAGRAVDPIALDGSRLYWANGKALYQYDVTEPTNPVLNWRKGLPGIVSGIEALPNGDIILSLYKSSAPNLLRLEPTQGNTLWEVKTGLNETTPGPIASMTVVDETIYLSIETSFQAFTVTGEKLWQADEVTRFCIDGGAEPRALTVVDETIYFSPFNGSCVFAISTVDGSERWTLNPREYPEVDGTFSFGGVPTYYQGVVYASNDKLWAIDAETGELLAASSARDVGGNTKVEVYNGELLVWGDSLKAFAPVTP